MASSPMKTVPFHSHIWDNLYYQCIQSVYDSANMCNKFFCVSSNSANLAICLPPVTGDYPFEYI